MKTKSSHKNKLLKIIMIPLRALGKAKDFYVITLLNIAEKTNYGHNIIVSMPPTDCHVGTLPRSFSVNSSKSYGESEDLRELIRVASTRALMNQVDDRLLVQQRQMMRSQPHKMPPRSFSLGMGKIDEDMPYGFAEENVIKKKSSIFSRSISCAVNRKSVLP